MAATQVPIAPGAQILVRDAVWRVEQVDHTSSGKAAWRVVGLSEIVRNQSAIFLEEYEPEVTLLDPRDTRLVADPTPGHRRSRLYLESKLRRLAPTTAEPLLARSAALDVMDFQLRPARLALEQTRPRILIADAVGLGKTLEAGILLSELMLRGRARRILVVTVRSVLTQFQKEMWTRFAIPLVRLDSVGLQRVREQIPTNHNPFHYYDKTIISIDTLKQNNAFRTHVERAEWDVIVIDEAHNVAARGSDRSQRTKIASVLADRSDALILLSATPHDGKAESFASLMNMLDPTAIADAKDYTREEIQGLFVRRFRKDVQSELGRSFPERNMLPVRAEASPDEERVFDALAELRFSAIDRQKHGAMLFRTTLEKALFSSPAACAATIRERLATIAKRPDAGSFDEDSRALRGLLELVEGVGAASFSKYRRLLGLLRSKDEFDWSPRRKDDRLVIFSERIETLKFLREQLLRDLDLDAEQVALLHGGSDVDQQAIVEEFGKDNAKVRVLLASDVASEGLNLHFLCHRLLHFDMPWSLMVFAQRNGRIDRYGQERTPEIRYFVTETANARIGGDLRILELLAERDQQAQKNIGDPSALMRRYEEEAEVLLTAQAIEAGESAESFEAKLATPETLSPLDLLLRGGPELEETPLPPTPERYSLFASDFAYAGEVLDLLAETEGLERRIHAERQTIEIQLPPDTEESRRRRLVGSELRRRLRKLPREVLPEDGVLVLTPDRARMQEEIRLARRKESAWPTLSFLWPLHPVLDWCNDKALAPFGKLEAPIVSLLAGVGRDEAVVVVSALLPNRRSQPLLHEWHAVRFRDGRRSDLLPFDDWARNASITGGPLPNRQTPVDTEALEALIPEAIAAVRERTLAEWKQREGAIDDKLNRELQRLESLRNRQFAQRVLEFGERDRIQIQARIDRIFDPFLRFVEESMTAGKEPFLEVLAVFRHEAGYAAEEAKR